MKNRPTFVSEIKKIIALCNITILNISILYIFIYKYIYLYISILNISILRYVTIVKEIDTFFCHIKFIKREFLLLKMSLMISFVLCTLCRLIKIKKKNKQPHTRNHAKGAGDD